MTPFGAYSGLPVESPPSQRTKLLSGMFSFITLYQLCATLASIYLVEAVVLPPENVVRAPSNTTTQVLILGGGVSGVIAARTLAKQGISDYLIVEALPELGGRMMSHTFGRDKQTIEVPGISV